ncbi:hypothetical protein, partial [Mesorhizobium sp. M00.F.Ca.ET.216.01.1.1]|uniref:hypothetical protein n=1 Tax=Mesorhizobium sp. M00.F.Ca.ET.216.01.1.1 TaxID=2500528 RepID=UPI001AEDAE28
TSCDQSTTSEASSCAESALQETTNTSNKSSNLQSVNPDSKPCDEMGAVETDALRSRYKHISPKR